MESWTYRLEHVRCGKPCKACPHGPYWYGYRKERGKTLKKYFGKEDPRHKESSKEIDKIVLEDPREAIFYEETATKDLAYEILELPFNTTWPEVKEKYQKEREYLMAYPAIDWVAVEYLSAAYHYLKNVLTTSS